MINATEKSKFFVQYKLASKKCINILFSIHLKEYKEDTKQAPLSSGLTAVAPSLGIASSIGKSFGRLFPHLNFSL